MDILYRQILPHLPPNLQAIILDPPSLTNPQSFLPVLKAIGPYTKWIIVILAFYIVYSTVVGIFGYFTRFLRFGLKIGPIIALIGWLMANSGQGSMDELFQAVKEYTGLAPARAGGRSPGIANLFGGGDPVSSRTRKRKASAKGASGAGGSLGGNGADILSSVLNSATGTNAVGDDWQSYVQDYVKKTMAKAAGLEWLFGGDQQQQPAGGRRGTR